MTDLERRSEFQRLRDAMRRGAAPAASTITDDQIKPPEGKVESARSPAAMERQHLALIRATADTDIPPEEVLARAMHDAGTSPEMLRQMADSPEFLPTLERIITATMHYAAFPGMMAAMQTKAMAGDVKAFTALMSLQKDMRSLSMDDEVKNLVRADDTVIQREFQNLMRDLQGQYDEMLRDHEMTDKMREAEKEAALQVTRVNRDMQKRRR